MNEPTVAALLSCLAGVAGCACLAGVSGCSFFYPDRRTPADHARELQPKCNGFTEELAAPLLSPHAIDAVEPAYSYVNGGPNGRDAHMRGSRIYIKPLGAFSKESIARTLECHESRVLLGLSASRADDPFVLPDRWLDIDVESEKGAFVVLVRTDDFDDARHALDRARLFLAARDRNASAHDQTRLLQSPPPSAAPVPVSAAAPLSTAGGPLSDAGQRAPLQ